MPSGVRKLNCWEYMKCGRGPGGNMVAEIGPCPAASEAAADGTHGGINGGRICWAIAGTFCEGRLQGSHASKLDTCLRCEFCKLVLQEEHLPLGTRPSQRTRARRNNTKTPEP